MRIFWIWNCCRGKNIEKIYKNHVILYNKIYSFLKYVFLFWKRTRVKSFSWIFPTISTWEEVIRQDLNKIMIFDKGISSLGECLFFRVNYLCFSFETPAFHSFLDFLKHHEFYSQFGFQILDLECSLKPHLMISRWAKIEKLDFEGS